MVKKFKTFGPQLVFAEQAAGSVVVLTNEQKLSLYKKSQKSGISTDVLEEVYRRGYSIWNESFGQTAEQFAFDRVNSFIAGGFAANLDEDLRQWFDPDHPKGGWKRYNSKGEAIGPCAREPGEAKPKCMSNEKAASLSKKERAAAVAAKRRHDPDPERKGKPINVSNYGKGKITEMTDINEENKPTNPTLWSRAKALARSKFDVYPSAYANGWAAKWYKSKGGGWKSVSEEVTNEDCWDGYKRVGMKKKGNRMVPNCVPVKEENLDETSKTNKVIKNVIAQKLGAAARKDNDPKHLSVADTGMRTSVADKIRGREILQGKDRLEETHTPAHKDSSGPFAIATKMRGGKLKRVPDTRFDTYESAHKYGMQYHTDKYGSKMFDIVQHPDAKKRVDEAAVIHKDKNFKTAETSEKQSKNPNVASSRFDGTKSAKNVYQKATPGQPITETNLKGDSMAALADRAKVLDQLVAQQKEAQNPSVKTSTGKAEERRQFSKEGELVTTVGSRGEKSTAVISNQATRKQPAMTNALTTIKKVVKEVHEIEEGWQDKKYKNPEGGLTRAGVMAYRRENPGSKLKTAVTTPPSKLKPGSKAANRRKSFCARMGGMKKRLTSAKTARDPDSRINKALRKWNCEETIYELNVPKGTTGARDNVSTPSVAIRMASGKIEKHPPGKSGSSGGGDE